LPHVHDPASGPRILWLSPAAHAHRETHGLLRRNGYSVQTSTLVRCERRIESIDLVIVDLPHVKADSLACCRKLSDGRATALLVLAPGAGVLDRISILEFGADGVLCSLSHPMEILASARAILRRVAGASSVARPPVAPAWTFDSIAGAIRSPQGEILQLSRADTQLLQVLASRPGELVPRERLLELLHEDGGAMLRSIDARVARLRRTLANCVPAGVVLTVRGKGYV